MFPFPSAMFQGAAAGGAAVYEIKASEAMAGTTNPSNSSLAVPVPASAAVGDVLFILVQGIGNSAGVTITPPAGTTEIAEGNLSGITDWNQSINYRVIDGTEGGSLTFTFSQAVRQHYATVLVSGANTTLPYEGYATATGNSSSMSGPATSTSSSNEIVLHFYADGINGAGVAANWLTPGAGWTELIDAPKDAFAGQGEGNLGVTYKIVATAGAVAAETATKSLSQRYRAFTLAVVPA